MICAYIMNNEFMSENDYNFWFSKGRRNISNDAELSLFSDEDLRFKILSKEDAEELLSNSDAAITKEQIDAIKKKMIRLKFDLDYFIQAYSWVEEDCAILGDKIYSGKLFYLFNNLAYQLRDFARCLSEYSDKCYLCIYNDLKAEIISAYNNEIKNALETLYRLYQKSKFHPKCVVDHIVLNTDCIGEILRCLQNHPSEEVREEFSLFYVDRFYEEAVFSSLVVFSFEELLPYANDIKDVIKEIELQKQEYRTVEECVYLYDVLYGRFQARHTEYNDEAEEALNRYLSEYQLERSVQNINKRKEAVVYDFKATSLGKIWDEYHHNKSKLVEKIVNAEASREDFEEYFRYVIKIEYLDKSYMTESKVDSNDPWLSALYAIIEHKYTPTSGDKEPYIKYQRDWYYVMRAAVELNMIAAD